MSIIAWVILGLISGLIASYVVDNRGSGAIVNLGLGIVGAVVGGFIFRALGQTGVTGLNLWSLGVSVVGAVVALVIYHAVVRPRSFA
ncbi:MAG: GlsB/YeaQ/YmgE family stress response membrane protein [Polyangiaceae bacterium]